MKCVCVWGGIHTHSPESVAHTFMAGGLAQVFPWLYLISEGDTRPIHSPCMFGNISETGIQCTKNILARGTEMKWKSTSENVSNFFQMSPISLVVGMLSCFPFSTFYSYIFKYEMSENKVFKMNVTHPYSYICI